MRYIVSKLILCIVAVPWLASSSLARSADAMVHTKADPAKIWADMLAKPSLAVSGVFDNKGRLWMVSIQGRHLYVKHSDDGGATLSAPVQVNSVPENILGDGENRPKLWVRNGAVYVSYTQALPKPMTGNIRFSRSTDGGKTFSAPVTVNDNREVISHRFEAMGVNDRGEIYLAWLDKRDLSAAQHRKEAYAGAAVYYTRSTDGGASFEANRKVADHSCECCRVAMAIDKEGMPVVFWRQIYGKNERDHALAKLDGKPQPVRVSHDNWEVDACPHHGPAISIGADGVYHMVWFDNAPTRHGLFYAHTGDGGKSFSEPLNFGNYDHQAAHPYVLSKGSQVFIVWKEFDGEKSVIYLMRSTDGGASWAKAKPLTSTVDNSDHPFLISNGSRVYLSWNTLKEGFRLIEVTGQ